MPEEAPARLMATMTEATPAAHQSMCTRAMQKVVDSLLDISVCYKAVAMQANKIETQLNSRRANPARNAKAIKTFEKLLSIVQQHLTARKAHDIAFKDGLRNPAHADPQALLRFVEDDNKKYMTMTTEWNSKLFMAMKSGSVELAMVLEKALEIGVGAVKGQNPELAARMRLWGKDDRKGEGKESKKTAAKGE